MKSFIIDTIVAAVLTVLILLFAGDKLGFNNLTLGLFSGLSIFIWTSETRCKKYYEEKEWIIGPILIGIVIIFWVVRILVTQVL